ncbi:MAG: class I SAM-dependent methyltransferase [Mycobacteriales bacterium]
MTLTANNYQLLGRGREARPIDLQRWPDLAPPGGYGVRGAIARRLMRRVATRTGIQVRLPDGRHFGPKDGPELRVIDPASMFARLGRDGKIGFGEAYMARDWDAPDLTAVLEPLARSVATLVPPKLQWIRRLYDSRHPPSEAGDREGAKRNIARHYDMSNELFALFLDPTMTYSSALFTGPGDTLVQAQRRKVERLLDLVRVGPGTRLLEIGTGWGELARRAGERGAEVLTVTLSEEQAAFARRSIAEARLSKRVEVRLQDYRDVTGSFDAIVSVEMIEAVGEPWWPTYFTTLAARLAPGGRIALQAILMPHNRMLASKRSWTWIHKYVFPGGQIPSEQAIETCAAQQGLRVADRLHFGHSYARTLQLWRERFEGNWREASRLGFDESFRRLWNFYLAYSEAGFRSGYLDVAQLLLTRPGDGR